MRNKKKINFAKIGLSLIFLFNPNINIIDVLPDFIGYMLLYSALTGLADMNDTVSEAHAMIKKLIFIDAAKLLSILWVFGISVPAERNSSLMLWSFAFGVLELIFVIPAFLKLFEGITGLGYLYQNSSVLASGRFRKKSVTDRARNLTVAFVGFKAVMSFLPELSDLTSTEYYENMGLTNLYRYIGVMRLLAFVPVFIFGVIWVIRINRYFFKINKDKDFVSALERIYVERVGGKRGIFVKRNISTSFFLLLAACIFSFDIRLENVNMLPDFVCGLFLVLFFISISKQTKIKRALPCIVCGVYTVVSAAAYIAENAFFAEYIYKDVDRAMDARAAFVSMATVSTVSTLLFAAGILLACLAIKKAVLEHTGAISISDKNLTAQQSLTESVHKELYKYIKLCVGALALYTATDICYIWCARFSDQILSSTAVNEHGALLVLASVLNLSLINSIGAIVFIGFAFKLYFEINEAVTSRYILE